VRLSKRKKLSRQFATRTLAQEGVPRLVLRAPAASARAFAFDPRAIEFEKRLCVASRAPPRQGDAHGTVGQHAEDVAPSAAVPNENDSFGRALKVEAQLHVALR
jgi:hypothetical protein